MAEAEDLLTDAARHATVFARELWRRHRGVGDESPAVTLATVTERMSLLTIAVFGTQYPIRVAQPPAPITLLSRVFQRQSLPHPPYAVPATDGSVLWLPASLGAIPAAEAIRRYRCMALSQAMRAARGSVSLLHETRCASVQSLYLLMEARATERQLGRLLPGMQQELILLRRDALARRPALESFPASRQPLEALVRAIMREDPIETEIALNESPLNSLRGALLLAERLRPSMSNEPQSSESLLYKDEWTGDLLTPGEIAIQHSHAAPDQRSESVPSARLRRRPDVRDPDLGEDDAGRGAWMIQTAQPQEHAEDPMGLQRPTDRDERTSADEFADSLSELPHARLVTAPGTPKEFLLSDDPAEPRSKRTSQDMGALNGCFVYPEWDFRLQAYRHGGATVHMLEPALGSPAWVTQTLRIHRAMCDHIRRRFELLSAQRLRLRRQVDGDDVDIDAYVDARADLAAGRPLSQALYQTVRCMRRDLAITLLIDISGSTDSWVSTHRRIIDIEREALLLVCIALEGLREPYSVLAFSGEGRHGVTMQQIKAFDEPYGADVALRISALEPDRQTRAGAAIRHASTLLMRQDARHRLLLLLSDGKPNDDDEYEGRYGAEDMRQAIAEARLQGIFPFCLTVDRHAASYLPQVFGAHQYALLTKPENLPTVLLAWLRRLVGNDR